MSRFMMRANAREWSPPVVCFLDTESRWLSTGNAELHTLRLWTTYVVVRRDSGAHAGREYYGEGTTVDELVDWLEARLRGLNSIWLFAHNLQFDLALTHLPEVLTQRGWICGESSLSPGSPIWRWRCLSKRITMVDSMTWLPRSLETIGELIGHHKGDMPENTAPLSEWLTYCRQDVAVLSRAMLELMDFWDRERLGNWSLTGPATGHNMMRHKFMKRRPVLDDDHGLRRFERSAIYGGRREVYRVGEFSGSNYVDWDMQAAYPAVVQRHLLPEFFIGEMQGMSIEQFRALPTREGIIARCHVRTKRPLVPCRYQGSVWYPVGSFTTVLTSPEIELLLDEGQQVTIGAAALYRLSDYMKPWADWIIPRLGADSELVSPIVRLWLKHMSRASIGKFASHHSRIERWHPAEETNWSVEEGYDATKGERFTVVNMAGWSYKVFADQEAPQAFPAVWAFIEAHVRVSLRLIMDVVGADRLMQVDTDGVLIEDPEELALDEAVVPLGGPRLAKKGIYTHAEIRGPQHLILDAERRLAGIPRGAERISENEFDALVWPGLSWQLTHGVKGGYYRPRQRYQLEGPYCRRWIMQDGTTAPVVMSMERGENVVRWTSNAWLRLRDPGLSKRQDPILAAVMPSSD